MRRICSFVPLLCMVAVALSIGNPASADTPVAGDQSGTWTLEYSPYVVIDNVTVPQGQVLEVQAGVEIKFAAGMKLEIKGEAIFQGTTANHIRLFGAPAGAVWQGVRVVGSGSNPPTSQFSYCDFSDAEFALHLYVKGQVNNAYTTLTTEVVGCYFGESNGVGIHAEADGFSTANPTRRLHARINPIIQQCIFDGCNTGVEVYPHGWCWAYCGAGDSNPLVENCVFMDASDAAFKLLTASYNDAHPRFFNNTVIRCENGVVLPAPYDGKVVNNIFTESGTAVQRTGSLSSYVHFNCFFDNDLDFLNYPTSGYGTPAFDNQHGDPSDLALNVFANPELENYHISSRYSACVDAGIDTLGTLMDIDNEPRLLGRKTDIGADESSFDSVPVFLSRFLACSQVEGVFLEWSIAGEVDGFFVERRQDNQHNWNRITPEPIHGLGNVQLGEYSWLDHEVTSGRSYSYRIMAFMNDGVEVALGTTSVTFLKPLPEKFGLHEVYPNPFNPQTIISFALDRPQQVRIVIYNMSGHLVTLVTDEVYGVGNHTAEWDGRDSTGRGVSSGTYLIQMETATLLEFQKVMLVR